MKATNRSRRVAGCVGVMLAAGMTTTAAAVDKSWNSDSGLWTEAGSWWPVGVPAATDHVFIGNVGGVQNQTVVLNVNETIAAMTVTDGMTFRNNNQSIVLSGDAVVSGSNTVPGQGGVPIVHASTIRLEPIKGVSFSCDDMSIADGARLTLEGQSFARFTGALNVDDSSRVSGVGILDFMEGGITLRNDGTINGYTAPGIYSRQFGGGLFDLDGTSGDGLLDLTGPGGGTLRIQGSALSDPFSGRIEMVMNSDLRMELTEGWTADQNSAIRVRGAGDIWNPAQIRGGAMTFGGELEVIGGQGAVNVIPSELVIQPSARFEPQAHTSVNIGAAAGTDTTIDGGVFSLADGAALRFIGPTRINGGEFETISTSSDDGEVRFEGSTQWAGSATFHGVVRQIGNASVVGLTAIHADVFDMDGAGATTWSIASGVAINAALLDSFNNDFDGTMNVSGGLGAMLTVNLEDPAASWSVSGSLRLGGAPGFFVTRLAGSPVVIYGDLDVANGRSSVSAPFTIANLSTVDFDASTTILRTTNECTIYPDVAFTGSGVLQNGPTGELSLLNELNTGAVGLVNQGVMRIGEGAGVASVDRFETTGTWEVEIGGHIAGTEHDRLHVSGGAATVAGTLDVRVTDGFRPAIGDVFTILVAVGGVNGAFPVHAVSEADGWTYEWTVTSNPNDVTLRLDGVVPPPCMADFNGDGVVNSQDFFDFLGRFFALDVRADVNADGVVNSQDFFDFLVQFFKGCE
jgi:hypothetical protein